MKTIVLIFALTSLSIIMANAVDKIKSEEEAKPDISNPTTIQSENTNPHHLKIEPYTLPDDIFKLLANRSDLTELDVYFTFFTDELAGYLPKLCPGIVDINLDHSEVTDKGVGLLAHGLKGLLRVNLDFNAVTDASLEFLGEKCQGLTSLSIKGNFQITDEGVKLLIRRCPALTNLDVSFTSCTAALLEFMREKRPNLIIERQTRPARLVPARKKSSNVKKQTSKAKK